MSRALDDLSGRVFGRLAVLQLHHMERDGKKNNHSTSFYLCLCKCGAEKVVRRGNLTSRNTVSCGCWIREQTASRRGPNHPRFKHGHATYENLKTYEKWAWANRIRKRFAVKQAA
jgi:hypothetical protein